MHMCHAASKCETSSIDELWERFGENLESIYRCSTGSEYSNIKSGDVGPRS